MKIRKAVRYSMDMAQSRIFGKPNLSLAFLYPTYRCNLKCVYCENPSLRLDERSTREWLDVIDQLAEIGCWRITLLGGDPLLRKDIPEIIHHIRKRGMSCVLTSNGILVPDRIKDIQELNTLVLSLDAAGPANDEIRGKGVFTAVKEAIKAAKEAGIPAKINSVLYASNSPHLDDMLAFIEQNDLSVTFNILRTGPPHLHERISPLRDSDEEIRAVLHKLSDRARKNPRILFSPRTFRISADWPDFSRDMYTAEEIPGNLPMMEGWPSCHAGRFFLTIDPSGNTFPCVLNAEKIEGGNVFTDGVDTCWKKLQKHECRVCYAPCLVELNQLFSLNTAVVFRFARRFLRRFY